MTYLWDISPTSGLSENGVYNGIYDYPQAWQHASRTSDASQVNLGVPYPVFKQTHLTNINSISLVLYNLCVSLCLNHHCPMVKASLLGQSPCLISQHPSFKGLELAR